jgi:lipopolysaccharide export system protein LptA
MRQTTYFIIMGLVSLVASAVWAQPMPDAKNNAETAPKQVDVSADQSLEWYQDKRMYVARGNAKAIRGETVIQADILSAHEREKPPTPDGKKVPKTPLDSGSPDKGTGDIDKMIAEGNVRITDPKQRVTGQNAIYDLDQHVAILTGDNLKYETEKETVTAKDSLEYWEDKKLAIARGNAVAVQAGRHIAGDVLTAEFKDAPTSKGPGGEQQLTKMSVLGHVVIVTKTDVSRGDKAVYDMDRNLAVLTGHVRITRGDGTQLSGDVGEVDLKTNESRLRTDGAGRVRALLSSSTTAKTQKTAPTKQASSDLRQ